MLPWRHNWYQIGLDTVSLLSSRNTSVCLNQVVEMGSVCVPTLLEYCQPPWQSAHIKSSSVFPVNYLMYFHEFNNMLIVRRVQQGSCLMSVSMVTGLPAVLLSVTGVFCYTLFNALATTTIAKVKNECLLSLAHLHSFSHKHTGNTHFKHTIYLDTLTCLWLSSSTGWKT